MLEIDVEMMKTQKLQENGAEDFVCHSRVLVTICQCQTIMNTRIHVHRYTYI